MKHENSHTDSERSKKISAKSPKPAVFLDGIPWNRQVYKLFERKMEIFSGVHIFMYTAAPGLNPEQTDPDLTFGELDPTDIPKLAGYRSAAKIQERLDEGHICRVAKNREGEIEQVRWCTNRPYLCWPVRTMIDPGPRGWYLFDGFTPPHARRKGRYAQNLDAWRRTLAPDEGPLVAVVSPLNTAMLSATRRVGLSEIARVCCLVILGCKLYRFTIAGTEIRHEWFFRPTGRHVTFDAVARRVY